MAIFSLLECFATFNKLPILERSIAVRRACFGIFCITIIIYGTKLYEEYVYFLIGDEKGLKKNFAFVLL